MKIVYLLVFTFFLSVNFLQAQVPNYVPSNGLVGWWPFNGNANDQSGNGNNGTVIGATLSADRENNLNSAYFFDGVNCPNAKGVSLPSVINNENAYSISLWFKTSDSNKSDQTIFNSFPHQYIGANFNYPFTGFENKVCSFLGNGSWQFSGSLINWSIDSPQNWHNLIVVKSTSLIRYYLDGILKYELALQPNFNVGGFTSIVVGAISVNGGSQCYETFKGSVDDIGIWNRALTDCEIQQLYASEKLEVHSSVSSVCPGGLSVLTVTSPLENTSICSGSALPAALQSGLVGYWPFCGNANDESGNGNNGTVNGATLTSDRFGNANNAYSFDGVDDFVEVVNPQNIPLGMSSRTFSCWVNYQTSIQPPIYNDWNSLICYGSFSGLTCNANYVLLNNNQTIHFATASGSCISYTSPIQSILGSWRNISIVYNGNSIKIYLDGMLIGENLNSSNTINTLLTNLFFGKYNNQTQSNQKYCLRGKLDDIAIWNRALSQQEITQLYNIGNPTYSWSTGATTPSVTVTPTATTTYSCAVTVNGQTCSDDVTIQVKPNSTHTISPSVCGTYTAPNGATYTSSGTYTAVIPNAAGCDSTITINLTVKQPSSASISPSVCGTYTAPNGTTYTTSGIYTAVIPNAAGCDSTITINLTVKQPSSATISPSVCGTYTAPNGTTYTTSGTYTAVIPNAAGCDSTITINLTVKQPSSATISPSVCGTYTAPNGISYTTSGTYTAVIPNAAGCDSTITINLTVKQPSSSIISPSVCGTYTAPNGTTYTSSGTYTAVIPNAAGCDSTITINLTVKQPSSSIISPSVCGTYTAPNGTTYTSSGTYTAVIPNAAGCDSTITINLTVKQPSSATISPSVCGTYTAPNGATYTSSGTYTAVIPNAAGCDSTITINLTVTPFTGLSAGADQSVCEGESVTLTATGASNYSWTNGIQNGVAFTPSLGTNVFTVTGTSGAGCTATDNVVVVVREGVAFNVQVEPPTCVAAEDGKITINTTAGSATFSYLWSTGATSGVLTAVRAGTYAVEVTDFYGCKAEQTIVVAESTNACLFISGGLTPNGDGKNDVWIIQGLSAYPEAKIWVFNRWGQPVYEGDSNSAPWDGTFKGEDLPSADYYYTISLAPDQVDQKGVVTLKR